MRFIICFSDGISLLTSVIFPNSGFLEILLLGSEFRYFFLWWSNFWHFFEFHKRFSDQRESETSNNIGIISLIIDYSSSSDPFGSSCVCNKKNLFDQASQRRSYFEASHEFNPNWNLSVVKTTIGIHQHIEICCNNCLSMSWSCV